jgi:integrase
MPKARRGRGEGGIRERTDGRWEAYISCGSDDSGKRVREYVYGATKSQAMLALEQLRVAIAEGKRGRKSRAASRPKTLADLFTRWLANVESTRTDATFAWYESTWRVHIKDDPIAAKRLAEIEPLDIDAFYARRRKAKVKIGKREVKVGPRTLEKIHVTLHKAFDVAMGWRILAMNPTDYVDRPKYRAPKIQAISGDAVRAFLAAIRGDRYEALYELALFCGLRSGEIYALKWADVDLKKRTVRISRIASEVSGKPVVHERTKTEASAATVPMLKRVAEALRDHRKKTMKDVSDAAIANHDIFAAPEGGLLRRSNFQRRHYFPLLKRAKIPRVRFHLLRKALGTLLASSGAHPKVTQSILRHESEKTSLRFYTDLPPKMVSDAIGELDRLFPRGRSAVSLAVKSGKAAPEKKRARR